MAKAHVIEKRWSQGGFHRVRFAQCRCGWVGEHYNAGALAELFDEHKRKAEANG